MGRERTYTPTPEDVGAILKFDCTAYDAASPYPEVGKTFSIITARVRPGGLSGMGWGEGIQHHHRACGQVGVGGVR